MSRTLSDIKTDIASRITSEEFLPLHIARTSDLTEFANAIGESLAQPIQNLEDFFDIWVSERLLAIFLKNRGMFLVGDENLSQLQDIASHRLKIMMLRGSIGMIPELRRLCHEASQTTVIPQNMGDGGWCMRKSSPMYKPTALGFNACYMRLKFFVVFKLKNQTNTLTNEQITDIIREFFEPKHIRVIYIYL